MLSAKHTSFKLAFKHFFFVEVIFISGNFTVGVIQLSVGMPGFFV